MKNTKFQKFLEFRKINQSQAARELGCSRQHISALIKGRGVASKPLAVKIENWSDGFIPASKLIGLDKLRDSQ